VAKDFRYPDRDQGFLLPPDIREWLPAEHLVWMVIEVVASLDLKAFRRRAKLGGAGRAPIDPGMLLALLIYAYAHGVRSSRQIERLCETDVAFRVICGNDAPDHTVIARFRAGNEDRFAEVFAQVLVLCAKAGLGKFGTVAIDGTKIAADASKAATRSEASLRAEAKRMLDEAADIDAAEDAEFGPDRRGDELPAELADPATRKARIAEALAQIEAEKAIEVEANRVAARVDHWQARVEFSQRRHDEILAGAEQRWAQRSAAEAATGRRSRGRRPVPPAADSRVISAKGRLESVSAERDNALAKAVVAPKRRRSTSGNTTDPDSRLLPVKGGFIQGFNAQLAVTADQLIVAVELTNNANDAEQLVPMMAAAVDATRTISEATGRDDTTIGTVLADAGYFTATNITAAGPDRLIAANDRRKHAETPVATGDPPPDATPAAKMRHRVATAEGRSLYRQRSCTVEPVNGHLKDRIGLRRFSRRGMPAGLGELNLAAATLNLLKLHRAAIA
jgi:transposase/predicted regulator of Ras-like GTPase activity (Roadblock/LC7/MglB family)